jgi:sensor histidine kinase YesM
VEGGEIVLRSYRRNGRLVLEVRDNGVGISAEALERVAKKGAGQHGIGISNVRERLRVLYGSESEFRIESGEAGGTSIQMEVPLIGN